MPAGPGVSTPPAPVSDDEVPAGPDLSMSKAAPTMSGMTGSQANEPSEPKTQSSPVVPPVAGMADDEIPSGGSQGGASAA